MPWDISSLICCLRLVVYFSLNSISSLICCLRHSITALTCLTPAASITLTLLTPCEFQPIHICCSSPTIGGNQWLCGIREQPKTHRFGPPTYKIHGNVMVVICEDAQHEVDITWKQTSSPSMLTVLSSPKISGVNLTKILANMNLTPHRTRLIVKRPVAISLVII